MAYAFERNACTQAQTRNHSSTQPKQERLPSRKKKGEFVDGADGPKGVSQRPGSQGTDGDLPWQRPELPKARPQKSGGMSANVLPLGAQLDMTRAQDAPSRFLSHEVPDMF